MIEASNSGESPFIADYYRPRINIFKSFTPGQQSLNPAKILDEDKGEYQYDVFPSMAYHHKFGIYFTSYC
jgi:hypothetical protein